VKRNVLQEGNKPVRMRATFLKKKGRQEGTRAGSRVRLVAVADNGPMLEMRNDLVVAQTARDPIGDKEQARDAILAPRFIPDYLKGDTLGEGGDYSRLPLYYFMMHAP